MCAGRPFIFFLSVIILFLSGTSLYSQSCEDCGKRNIGVYDPSVLVPRPEGDDTTLKRLLPHWWQLFRVGTAIRGYLHNDDPTGNCFFYTDINVFRAEEGTWSWKDSLTFGNEWANTPPAGPVKSLDYLIESTISGVEGNYVLNASVQAAVSREIVTSGSINFSDMWNATDFARQLSAQSFSPLYNKIREWEEKKRDEDPEVTIGAERIKIKPEKNSVEVNEEISVELEFVDCDAKPLKNKRIQLIDGEAYGITLHGPRGGKFNTSYVTTDDEGKAKVTFIAGDKPGEGILTAYFPYKFPSGHNGIAGGEAIINISQAPVEYWEVNAAVTNYMNYQRDTSTSSYFWESFYESRSISNGSVKVRGLIKNEAWEPDVFSYMGNDSIVAAFASGGNSEVSITNEAEFALGSLVSGDKRKDVTSGMALSDFITFLFYYNEDSYKQVEVSVGFTRVGEYTGQWFNGPDWVSYSGEYNDSLGYVGAGWDSEMSGGYMYKTDTGYVAGFNSSETYKENTVMGTATITKEKTLSVHIRPYSYLTSVKEIQNHYPEAPVLFQNYPNPFNPLTNINFYLSEEGMVTIKIYDILGNEISTLINDFRKKGSHSVELNAGKLNLSSGIYFYRMTFGNSSLQKKLILVK